MVTPVLSILVLSEDSSASAHETVSLLARRMLQLVDRHSATHRIRFQPTKAGLAVRANIWQSKKPHSLLVDLKREIARKVLEDGIPGYVLFHFDGDCPWSEWQTSTNAKKFESFVEGLRPLVEKNLRDRGMARGEVDIKTLVSDRLRRICPVTPFYSIESWLYQNTHHALELCRGGCGKHLELISQWEADRYQLDEVLKPKEQLCFGSRKNTELADGFTKQLADELYLLGQSFHATVERLQACPGLQAALRATWSTETADSTRTS
jgi:hypothetical protein